MVYLANIESNLNRLVWQRFFVLGIPSLVNLRERLYSKDPDINNTATKLLFAVLCLTACAKSEEVRRRNDALRDNLQKAISSYGQDFIFSPPTHTDSIVLCRLLATYNPTALATSQRVAHQSVKAELYINLAYRIAERLEMLPEPGHLPFMGTNTIDDLGLEHELILSVQGLQLIAEEFLLGDFVAITPQAFRQVLQRMQPHIDAYQVLLQTRPCSPIMIFHIKWTTATYMQIEFMAETKQNWMNPSRLFIVVEEGEKKSLAEINSAYQLFSEASLLSEQNEQNELMAMCSLLELRFHGVIARLFGLGLFYTSIRRARAQNGQSLSNAEITRDEVTRMGDVVINSLLTTPDHERNDDFFNFLHHFGSRYPDKMLGILAKFVECATMKLGGNDFLAPVRPIVMEIVSHCKNMVENNLVRFKVSGRLHPNFDKQMDSFKECAHHLGAMVTLPGSLNDTAFSSGCVYSASSRMITGLTDLMGSLKLQASLVKDWDEANGLINVPAITTVPQMPAMPPLMTEPPTMQFNSFETWNLWPCDTMERDPPQDMFDWTLPPSTTATFDDPMLNFTQ